MAYKKHEVLTTFRDKETGQLILAGSFFGTENENRLENLFNRGLLKSEQQTTTIEGKTNNLNSQKFNEEFEFPKHTGGGYFELSNGEKVKGKEDALAAEEELKKSGD